jgi:chemotaxis protein CheD
MQKKEDFPSVFLQTGDCYLAVQPTMVTTVLGSCVAVTMTHPGKGIGAICHAFLPDSLEGQRRGERDPQICRYVDTAISNMLQGMNKLRVPISELQVKLFGGASGLAVRHTEHSTYNVGQRNVDAAKKMLSDWGLRVETMDVGGNRGRKIHYLTHSGEVWMKRLADQPPAQPSGR